MDKVYNYEFDEADKIFNLFKDKVQNHPIKPFLFAQHLYWKEFPMERKPLKVEIYQTYLIQTLSLSEELLKKEEESPEGIFFSIASHGGLAGIYLNKNNYLKTANEAQKTYSMMKKAFSLLNNHKEFLLPCGSYNYFVEVYPEVHPFYKPFVFFFKSGNKAKGLQELVQASNANYLINVEALQFLSHIYLHYELDYEKALLYAEKLILEFPQNPYFISVYIETLLEKKDYIKASEYLHKLEKTDNIYFDMIHHVFSALIEEHSTKNYKKAKYIYDQAIEIANSLDRQAYHYKSMAYYQLGNIAYHEGRIKESEKYFEESQNFSIYNKKLIPYNEIHKK